MEARDFVIIIASLLGSGGLLGGIYALLKLRPEAGQITVIASEKVVVMQTGVIEKLEARNVRLQDRVDALEVEKEHFQDRIDALEAENSALLRRLEAIERKLARLENGLNNGLNAPTNDPPPG